MQRCQFCNAELPEQAGFCGNCGRSQTRSGIQSDVGMPAAIDVQSLDVPTFISDPLLPTSLSERPKQQYDPTLWGWTNDQDVENRQLPANPQTGESTSLRVDPFFPGIPSGLNTPPVGSTPMVQGTPAVGGVPSVQGTPSPLNSPTPMTSNPLTAQGLGHGTAPSAPSPSMSPPTPPPSPSVPPSALPQSQPGWRPVEKPATISPQRSAQYRQSSKKARSIFNETTARIVAYPQTLFHVKNIKVLLLLGAIFIVLGGSGVLALDEASERGDAAGFLGFDEPFERQVVEPFTHAQAHATATAYAVVATGTAGAAAVLQHPYPQGGTLIYNNTLSSNSKTFPWVPGYQVSGADCSFMNRALHIVESNLHHFYYCIASKTNFSNFKFQAQMTILKGNAGGIVFRDIGPENNYFRLYYFSIGQDGSYSLQRFVHSPGNSFSQLAHGQSTFIKTGLGQTNLITVVARGNNIDLYVNQQYLASVTDSTYTQGQIGLAAQSQEDPTEVMFSNAQVYALP